MAATIEQNSVMTKSRTDFYNASLQVVIFHLQVCFISIQDIIVRQHGRCLTVQKCWARLHVISVHAWGFLVALIPL